MVVVVLSCLVAVVLAVAWSVQDSGQPGSSTRLVATLLILSLLLLIVLSTALNLEVSFTPISNGSLSGSGNQ